MNAILEQINSAGLIFVEFALPMLVQSSVLILILLLTDFALRKKVRAVFRYGIWLLVLVKLVLPTSLSAPLSLGYFFGNQLAYVDGTETTTETAQTAPAIVTPMINPPRIEAGSDTSAIATTTPTIEPAVTGPLSPPIVPVVPLSWQGAVFLAWLTVVLTMGLLLLQRAIFVRGLVAQAKEANSMMNDTLESCCERMVVKRKIVLKVSANATSPAVCGLFRPVILVPQNLMSSLNPSQLRAVLLHELAHIKRGDLWVNLAQTVLQIIYFYNPLLWVANCIIRRVREQAVDEMVLVAMGEKAQQYPQTLVNVAKLAFKRPALSLRLIGVVESKSALAGRIKHILNRPMPKKAKLGILGLAVVIIIAAILLPMATSMPGPPGLIIKGMVKDAQTGEPIAGARVFDDGYGPKPKWEQIKADERSEWGAITNTAGEYSFLTWPEHHSIKVEAPGYKAERQSLYDGHFTLNKKDEEIFDFALEPEKASDSSEFNTKLPNGVTVELIGLFGSESKGQLTLWRPDGTAMSKEESKSYEYKINPGHIRNRDDWKFEYGYILKFIPSDDLSSMTDVTVGHRMRYTFPREDGIGVVYVESDEYQRKKGLAKIGEIRAAAAYGQPKSFSSESRVGQDADIFQLDDGATILLSAARPDRYQPDRGLMVDTTVNAGDVDIKVFYESKDGNMRKAWADGITGGPSLVSPHQRATTLIQQTFRLHSIAKEELKKIIVECRRFQGVTFKNVALKPGMKTTITTEYIQPEELIDTKANKSQAYSIYPVEPASRRPRQPIAIKNVRPMNPEFTAELDNGTSVELLALTKFEGGALRWWSPEGQPIELPSITAQDIKHQGNIAAFRFYGPVDSFTSYCMIASSMHEIKEKWQIASSGVWLGVLGYPEERNFGKLYFRTKGKPGQTIYTIPIKPSDIGKIRAINQYGVNNIQSFERTAFDGFTIELLHDDKLAGDEFAAVDRAGKMHEYTEGYSARNRSYMKYEFPAEELAAIVRQKFSYSTVQFVNVSLQGKKTKVVIEHIQRGELEQPKVNVDVNPRFIATMPNGVKVSLVALGRFANDTFQWWTPEGQATNIPGILVCDVEGYDVVLAYKVHGGSTFTSYSVQDDQLHRNKDDWLVRSHGLWMVPLDKTDYARAADFAVRAHGGPLETRLEIPLSEKEIGQEIEINKLGYEKVAEFTEVTTDSFRVKITYSSTKRAHGKFIAVDKAGKAHKRTSGAFWPGRCEITFPISAKKLSHLVLQRQQISQATFRNISMQPGQITKVQTETRKVDYLIPPSQAKWSVQDITTDVQVGIEPEKPAGQVQGEGGAPKQLSSGGGYQNLSREQRERLERLRANRKSLSYKNMQKLGLAVAVFANDHKGRCPSNLSDLRKYIADEQIFDWINRNVVYLGKNQQYGAPPDAVLAYDESMLKKPRQETNVLYNDAHVSFEKSEWLQEQGIILEQKPAGVGLNEKSINSDSKVKVGGIVQVEDKPVVGEWENISTAIPVDCNDTVSLAEHITLGSIGQDAEGKTFIALLRDKEKTRNQRYRFVLVRRNGTVMEPASYNPLLFGDKLWERFSFYMPYHHNQIKEFRLQRFPQSLARKASLPVVKPYDPGVNGKIVARATSAPPGRGALHFDGQNDYLYVPDSRSLWMKAPFTVEMWIKPEFPKEQFEGRPGWGLIGKGCIGKDWIFGRGKVEVEMRGFGITLHRFGDDPNLLMVDYCAANAGRVYTKPYGRRDFDDWLHLYHVFRPDRYTPGHTHPLVIGRFLTTEHPFAGQIGEVRIWAGARSRDQISQYRNKPLTGDEPDLVACWTFEQSGGQIAYDVSSNRNHARLGRTTDADDTDPTWVTVTDLPSTGSTIDEAPGSEIDDQVLARSTVGPVGRHALSFDGIDDYLYVAANPTLTLKPPFTIEMWLKPDFSEIQRTKDSEKLLPYLSLLRKGKRLFQEKRIQAGGFLTMFVGPSSQPDWKCLASLYLANAQGQAYQVDGSFGDKLQPARPGWLYVSMSCTRETYIPVPDQPILIGENIVPSGFPFKGEIADIRIWSKVLTDIDFLRYGYTSLAGSEPNLVACWDFKLPGGQVVYDISPNGNHARLGDSEGPDDADPKWVDLKAASHQPGQNPSVQVED